MPCRRLTLCRMRITRRCPMPRYPRRSQSSEACDAWTGTKLLLEFLVLTAVRTNEARRARWSEVDFAAAMWVVPGCPHEGAERTFGAAFLSGARGVARRARSPRSGAGSTAIWRLQSRVSVREGACALQQCPVEVASATSKSTAFPTVSGRRLPTGPAETGVSYEVGQACLSHAVGSGLGAGTPVRSALISVCTPMEDWGRFVVPDRSVSGVPA